MAHDALRRIGRSGAEYGDIRFVDTTNQAIYGEDRRIARVSDSRDFGFGVRVLFRGAWGFAASCVSSAQEIRRVTDSAIQIARG